MKILVVEDDIQNANYIKKGFEEQGHVVDLAKDGQECLLKASDRSHSVIVLDRMLPDLEGVGVLKALRALGLSTPIILLTAMGSIDDRVQGLEAGADDYLVKPFAFSELHARVINIVRRASSASGTAPVTHLKVKDLDLDLLTREVKRQDTVVDLNPTEFRLLEYFMRHPGQVLTKTMLLEAVWDFNFDPKTNIVETHVSRLRSKINKGFNSEHIVTLRGAGYKLES